MEEKVMRIKKAELAERAIWKIVQRLEGEWLRTEEVRKRKRRDSLYYWLIWKASLRARGACLCSVTLCSVISRLIQNTQHLCVAVDVRARPVN